MDGVKIMRVELKLIYSVDLEIDVNNEDSLNELGFWNKSEIETLKNGKYRDKCSIIESFIDIDEISKFKEFDEVEVLNIEE